MIACPNLLQRKSLWTNIRYLRQFGKWAEAITFELIDEEAASAGKPYPWPSLLHVMYMIIYIKEGDKRWRNQSFITMLKNIEY